MVRVYIRTVACHSEAEMRAGWDETSAYKNSKFRWRYCSTDTCGVCNAGPGEVCISTTEHDYSAADLGKPLPYFHMQVKSDGKP